MNPTELRSYLDALVTRAVRHAAMIWGPPGVGKSSIVAQTALAHGLEFVDVRLSQLAPTDLRGLPVASEGVSTWFPPDFLPRDGKGILFLDELNMAPPTMQGVAQQLILDRRVGSYTVPDGWYVWAAGNRKEDRASVFDMPAPLANRFLHVSVEPDLDSFRAYAASKRFDERITSFLAFRPQLLHALGAAAPASAGVTSGPAWPSPRSWEMANTLLGAGLDIESAVGAGACAEFEAFCEVYAVLPKLETILIGEGDELAWPDDPSARYAMTLGLGMRADAASKALAAFAWMARRATPEWVQLFVGDVATRLRAANQLGVLATIAKDEPAFREFVREYAALTGHGARPS